MKNIERVNIRFKVANTLRLENDTNATTKGNPNTLIFELVSEDGVPAAETMAAAAETTVKRRTAGIREFYEPIIGIYHL